MSAVVEICVGEFAKLREKVRARKPILSRAKKEEESARVKEEEKERSREVETETAMSEATICLLMDRFAPC
ncbi:mRNA,: RTFL01-34-C05 [Melia azedarach]|uniref:mRNA,: RTFL01-34-C05 n=1 Tax=Melia azedarach TaxID=155640 RepID=A0ACC1XZN5_MELAZ|nr:mRNA,: RTFL01-34-C05 [Melia azedarach]